MGRIRSAIFGLLVYPIFLLSRAIPKSEHEIYGSFHGRLIGDNALYSFLTSTADKKYFISKSLKSVKNSNLEPKTVLYCFSLRGIWVQLTAKKSFFSHTIDDFFAPFIMGSKIVSLGHGVPIKKSALADQRLAWITNPVSKFLILNFVPYLFHYYCHEVHSPSPFFDKHKLQVYGYTNPQLIRSKMPRTANAAVHKRSTQNRILYAPTFRKYKTFFDTITRAGLFSAELEDLVASSGMELWIKPHYLDKDEIESIELPDFVRLLNVDDVNSVLAEFDSLITDYSSIFYDASVFGLRVSFLNSDLEEYLDKDTDLFDWFKDIVMDSGKPDLSSALKQIIAHDTPNIETYLK